MTLLVRLRNCDRKRPRAGGKRSTPAVVTNLTELLGADIITVLALTVTANVFLFAFTDILARSLPPATYGLFASLFSLIVLTGLAATALQTAIAARVAAMTRAGLSSYMRRLVSVVLTITAAFGLGGVAIAPDIAHFVRTENLILPALVALIAALLLPWSAFLGVLQGRRQFKKYGFFLAFQAACRLAAATTLLITGNLDVLFLSIALATAVPTVVGSIAVAATGGPAKWPGGVETKDHETPGYVRTFLVSIAVGFPTVGDVFLVRHIMGSRVAGSYAAVALVGRCIVFISVGVNAVYIPRIIGAGDRLKAQIRRQALLTIAGAAGFLCGIVCMFPHVIMHRLVGPAYQITASDVRLYGLAGALFAAASTVCFTNLTTARRWALEGLACAGLAFQLAVPLVVAHKMQYLLRGELTAGAVFLSGSLLLSLPWLRVPAGKRVQGVYL